MPHLSEIIAQAAEQGQPIEATRALEWSKRIAELEELIAGLKKDARAVAFGRKLASQRDMEKARLLHALGFTEKHPGQIWLANRVIEHEGAMVAAGLQVEAAPEAFIRQELEREAARMAAVPAEAVADNDGVPAN